MRTGIRQLLPLRRILFMILLRENRMTINDFVSNAGNCNTTHLHLCFRHIDNWKFFIRWVGFC